MNKLSFLIIALFLILSACVKQNVAPNDIITNILFGKDTVLIYVGTSQQINVQITPSDYKNSLINWASSDTTVISLANGTFKAKKTGSSRVTVSSNNSNISASCVFIVQPLSNVNTNQLPGKATDIGIGANGDVYITGTELVSSTGGFAIKKWNGNSWTIIPECAAVRIAVGPDGKPWVVNKSNLIFRYDGGPYWTQLPGSASDIAVGADGSAYIIGTDYVSTTGGFNISKWNGYSWTELAECAGTRIAVAPDGTPWVVNKSGLIFKYNSYGKPWAQYPGTANDIGISANGDVFITNNTTSLTSSDFGIKKLSGSSWSVIMKNGAGTNISVSPQGIPYWINTENDIFKIK